MGENWIGSWTPLFGGRGLTLTVDGDYTVAAQLTRLNVWLGDRLIAQAEAPAYEPGLPRLVEGQVLWGDGKLTLEDSQYRRMNRVAAVLIEGTDAPQFPSPGSEYLPATYAWAADGQALVVSATWSGISGPPPARVLLLDGSGEYQTVLWQGSDLAPKAAWVGRSLIVVGFREPKIFDRSGSLLMTLEGITPAARIEASEDETRLLVVEYGRVNVWDTATWTSLGEWKGNWLDAAMTPDGRTVIGVDFAGRFQIARVADKLIPVGEVMAPDQARAIALGQNRVVSAFATGEAVRTAPITILQPGETKATDS